MVGASRASMRAASSSAASRLKVATAMRSGGTPRASSTPSRAISVVVLPLPAGAMIRAGPSGSVAAARCSASRLATSASATAAACAASWVMG